MSTRNSTFGGVILQDFPTRPLTSGPPKSIDYSSNNSSSFLASNQNNNNASFYCPSSTTPPRLVTDFHFDPLIRHNKNNNSQLLLQKQQQQQQKIAPKVYASVDPSPYDQNVGVAASNYFTIFGKRFGELSPSERRKMKMIKNRESATRSRARKQAYTIELEQQVQQLKEENARLRRQQQEAYTIELEQKVQLLQEENARLRKQQQELREAESDGQQKKKNSLYGTSTI